VDQMKYRLRKGTTFLEVLVAMTILALLIVGILQMFVMSLGVNQGAASRTQLTYKAQQIAEIVKMYQFMGSGAVAGISVPSGVRSADGTQIQNLNTAQSLSDTSSRALPYTSSDQGWDFWGPQGMNVIEEEGMPYKLAWRVTDGGNTWDVIVSASPVLTEDTQSQSATTLYRGAVNKWKKVEYVTSIKKN
jgi:hypothetical protein